MNSQQDLKSNGWKHPIALETKGPSNTVSLPTKQVTKM